MKKEEAQEKKEPRKPEVEYRIIEETTKEEVTNGGSEGLEERMKRGEGNMRNERRRLREEQEWWREGV